MANDNGGLTGHVNIKLIGPDGVVKLERDVKNLITTAGDQYYAKQGATGVGGNAAPTLAAKMQVGTGSTAVAKSGAGATIVTFVASSGVAFDSVTPAVVSGDTGWKLTYVTTFPAGTGTATITEAVITTQTGANVAATVSDTIARVLTGSITKGASDSLVLTWQHTFLGA